MTGQGVNLDDDPLSDEDGATSEDKLDPRTGCLGVVWVGVLFLFALGQWCLVVGFFGDPAQYAPTNRADTMAYWLEVGMAVVGIVFFGGMGAFSIVAALAYEERVDKLYYSSFAIFCLSWPVYGIVDWIGILAHPGEVLLVSIRLVAITVPLIIQFNELEFPTETEP